MTKSQPTTSETGNATHDNHRPHESSTTSSQRQLKQRWVIFTNLLISGHSATDAYIQAGYKTTSRRSAESAASRLRRHPEVKARLLHLSAIAREESRQRILLALRLQRLLSKTETPSAFHSK